MYLVNLVCRGNLHKSLQHLVHDYSHSCSHTSPHIGKSVLRCHYIEHCLQLWVPTLDRSEHRSRPLMQQGSPAVCRQRWPLQYPSRHHRLYPIGLGRTLPLSLRTECYRCWDAANLIKSEAKSLNSSISHLQMKSACSICDKSPQEVSPMKMGRFEDEHEALKDEK